MPIQLFRSRKLSIAKGNTLKKPSPPESPTAPPPSQSDGYKFERLYAWSPRRSIHHILGKDKVRKVDSNAKEEKKTKSKSPGRRASVMLRTLADPYHASLVNGDCSMENTDTQQEIQSPNTAEEVPLIVESPPNAEVAQRVNEEPMLNLLLGRHDPSSHFFTQRYVRIPNNSSLQRFLSLLIDSTVPLTPNTESLLANADMDPYAFELFRIWSRTGNIPILYRRSCCDVMNIDPKYTWQACWPLMNTVIAGHALGEPMFTDRVMDTLAENVVKGVCADATTINHLFSQKDVVPQVLQQFVVDRCIDSYISSLTDFDVSALPVSFVVFMLQTSIRRLSCPRQVPLVPDCTYHTHKALKDCYKRQATPAELRKSARLKLQRQKSRRDVAEFIESHRNSGVKATDWEDRRFQARQVQINRWDDGIISNGNMSRQLQEISAVDPESYVIGGIRPNKEDMPGEKDHASTPSSFQVGTAQLTGSVEEVRPEPPTRTTPPPPPSELEGATAYTMPMYTVDRGSSSPFSTSRSTQSTPDSELRHAVEILLEYERRTSSCPGAFPESSAGSSRTLQGWGKWMVKWFGQ